MDGKSGSSGAEVLKDVFARDRREEERERLAQQEEHRKKLLGKLTDPSQVEDLDPAQVIINEHTDGAILDLNSGKTSLTSLNSRVLMIMELTIKCLISLH